MNFRSYRRFLGPALLAPLLALSCSSPAPRAARCAVASTRHELRDPYTRYFEIWASGEKVGYLLSYEPVPVTEHVQRDLITGSHRIQDLAFEDVGFISPGGEVRRHTVPGESESLGYHELIEGLTAFYTSPRPVVLRPLQVPKSAEVK